MPDLYAHPQAVAFLREIIDHPEDDTPRLVFADWLDDHGDSPRAEFIRTQIEREKLPAFTLRHRQLLAQEEQLIAQHGAAWRGRLGDFVRDATFCRGFVEEVRLGVRQFIDSADELFSLTPLRRVQMLRVNHSKLGMTEIATHAHVRRLRGISLSGSEAGDDKLSELLTSLESDTLEELDLTRSGLGEKTLAALGVAKLPRLRSLTLTETSIGPSLHRLTETEPVFTLRELDLSGAHLSREDVQPLWDWPGLASVETLDLSYVRIGMRGAQAMSSSPHLGMLKHLRLINSGIGQGGARALADCAKLAALASLALDGNNLKVPGLQALLASPHLTQLADLDLADNALGAAGLAELAAWPRLARVTLLDLGNNQLDDAALQPLLASPHLGSLVEFVLRENYLRAAGARILADSAKLASLHTLSLMQCSLDSTAANALADSPHLRNLHGLDVRMNPLLRREDLSRLKTTFPRVLE